MYVEDDFQKFTQNLGKHINAQWSKLKSSSSGSQSEKNIDQQLEEEYEILLKEIDYLAAEKSCYLSFLNDNFHKGKSSKDLSTILNKHSAEVLKNYVRNHDKEVENEKLINRQDLISYVTEIVISRNKVCNNKLCSCKPITASKEVLTDGNARPENGKRTQTNSKNDSTTERATDVKPIIAQQANQTKPDYVTETVQTDDWSHDPLCKCGCCPKTGSEIDNKGIITDKMPVQDATTSDRKITISKNVLANCVENSVAANTSKRLCVPSNFEKLLEENEYNRIFSMCTVQKDCACDTYDINEALARDLKLPASDICIQKKKIQILEKNNKEENANQNKKDHKNRKQVKQNKSSKFRNTPRGNSSKKNRGFSSCFGKKRTSSCDLYCLGRSEFMQTVRIKSWDKSQGACLCNEINGKAAQTATEVATQVSARSSQKDLNDSKEDSETLSTSDKKQKREFSSQTDKKSLPRSLPAGDEEIASGTARENEDVMPSKVNKEGEKTPTKTKGATNTQENTNRETDNRDRDNREKVKDSACSRCGRLKRYCVSGCRNTFIIPYASNSQKGLPAEEVSSLRMLIKMQSRDTNRQFDNIMAELNHQRSEVRRLNDMYKKMTDNFYEMQNRSQSKRPSDLSRDCRCSIFSTSKKSDTAQACGCSVSEECEVIKKLDRRTERSNDISVSNNSNNTNNFPLKRFGPPNTVVPINRCDVEVSRNSSRSSLTSTESGYQDGDKQRKNQLNQSKKTENSSRRNENIPNSGTGDSSLPKANSVSTLYKTNKRPIESQIETRNGQEILLDSNLFDYIKQSEVVGSAIDVIETERDDREPERKTNKGLFNSKILIWLKKSWISVRPKKDEPKKRENRSEDELVLKRMVRFCQDKAKHAATGMWTAAKNAANHF